VVQIRPAATTAARGSAPWNCSPQQELQWTRRFADEKITA
jgi:hypothetical protein